MPSKSWESLGHRRGARPWVTLTRFRCFLIHRIPFLLSFSRPVRGAPVSRITTTCSLHHLLLLRFNVSHYQIHSSRCTRPHQTRYPPLILPTSGRRILLAGLKLQRRQSNAEGVDRRLDWHLPRTQGRCLEHKTFVGWFESRVRKCGFYCVCVPSLRGDWC